MDTLDSQTATETSYHGTVIYINECDMKKPVLIEHNIRNSISYSFSKTVEWFTAQ